MISYVFPGQGSQFPGMGQSLYQSSEKARLLMEEANDILGFRITDIMFGGSDEDLRAASGEQDYPATAPLNIALVAEKTKITGKTPEGVMETIFTDSGFICQNFYLFCASEGLATVTRAWINRPRLATLLHLSPTQHVTLVQTIGWKAEE